MNASTDPAMLEPAHARPLTPSTIRAAREAARAQGRSAVQLLEETLGLPSAELMQALGRALRHRVLDLAARNRAGGAGEGAR